MASLETDPAVIKSHIERLQQELEERERKFERSLIKSQMRQGAILKEFTDYAKNIKPSSIIGVSNRKSRYTEVPTNSATDDTQIKIKDNKKQLEVEFQVSSDRKEDHVFKIDRKKVETAIETNSGNVGADNSSRKSKRNRKSIDYSEILKGNALKRSKIDPKEVAALAFEVLIQAAKERSIEDFHLPLNFFPNYSYSFSSIITRIDNDVRNSQLTLDAKAKITSRIPHGEYSKGLILHNQSVQEGLKSSLEDKTARVIQKESQFLFPTKLFCNENNLSINAQNNCRQKQLEIFSVPTINSEIPNCPIKSQTDTKEIKECVNLKEKLLEFETEDIFKNNLVKTKISDIPKPILDSLLKSPVKSSPQAQNIGFQSDILEEQDLERFFDEENAETNQKPDSVVACEEHDELVISKKESNNESLDILSDNLNNHEETKNERNVAEMILENDTEDIFLDKSIEEGLIAEIDSVVACKGVISKKESNDESLNIPAKNLHPPEETKNERNVGEMIIETEDIFLDNSIEEGCETDQIADIRLNNVKDLNRLEVSDCANLVQIDHEQVLSNQEAKCILAKKYDPSGESIIERKDKIEVVFVENDTEDIFIDKSIQEEWESNVTVIPDHGLDKLKYSEELSENVIGTQTKEISIQSDLEDDTVFTQFDKTKRVREREYVNEINRNNVMNRNTLKDIGNIKSSQSKNNWEGHEDDDAMDMLFIKKRSSNCFKCAKNEPVLKIHYVTKESQLIAVQQLTALQFLKLDDNCEWEELHHISLVEDIIVSFVVVDYIVIITMKKIFMINYNDFTEFYEDYRIKCPQNLMACSLENSYFAICSIAENDSSITIHKIKSDKKLSAKELERSSEKLTSICAVTNLAKVMAGITSTGIILWSYRLGNIKLIINFEPKIESPFKIHWIQREMKDNLLYCLLKRNDLPNTNLVVINPVTGKHQILRKYQNGMKTVNNKRYSFSVNNSFATEVISKKKLIVYDFYHGIEKATLESESLTTGVVFPNGKTNTNIILTGYDNGCLHTLMM